MDSILTKEKLHQFIDLTSDEKAEALYTLFENDIDLNLQRKALILAERKAYIENQGTNFNWAEIKKMAISKDKRNAI